MDGWLGGWMDYIYIYNHILWRFLYNIQSDTEPTFSSGCGICTEANTYDEGSNSFKIFTSGKNRLYLYIRGNLMPFATNSAFRKSQTESSRGQTWRRLWTWCNLCFQRRGRSWEFQVCSTRTSLLTKKRSCCPRLSQSTRGPSLRYWGSTHHKWAVTVHWIGSFVRGKVAAGQATLVFWHRPLHPNGPLISDRKKTKSLQNTWQTSAERAQHGPWGLEIRLHHTLPTTSH